MPGPSNAEGAAPSLPFWEMVVSIAWDTFSFTTHANQPHSSQEHHPPASYLPLAFVSRPSPSAMTFSPLNNAMGEFSVTSSARVALAAFHPGGCTACPCLQAISLPLLPSDHSLLRHPLGWHGCTLPLLFTLSLGDGSPHFSITPLLDHEQGYVHVPYPHSSPQLFPPPTHGGTHEHLDIPGWTQL